MALAALIATAACADKHPTGTAGAGSPAAPTAAATPAAAPTAATAQAPTVGATSGQKAAERMTAEQLQTTMKTINATSGSLGMKLMGGDLPGAAKDAQTLATTFADVERFFAQTQKADAVNWAKQARMTASEAAAAATAGNAAKANASWTAMTGMCRQCHGAYREGDPQAGYRLKAGVL